MRTLSTSVLVLAFSQLVFAHQVTRVSVSSAGIQGDGTSEHASLSADGRFVAFSSLATNLVPQDENGKRDVFIRDLQRGLIERVAEDADHPSISGDGRYVAYTDKEQTTVYVRDLVLGSTIDIGPGQTPAISEDGQVIAFESENNVFLFDSQALKVIQVTAGNARSTEPRISRNGRYVSFRSDAYDLVPLDTNGWSDAFIYDARESKTALVSISTLGSQGDWWSQAPVVTDDGRVAFFVSRATNLVDQDSNGHEDIFVRDIATGTTTLLKSPQGNGDLGYGPSISRDGRYVAFDSTSTNLIAGAQIGWSVFVYDRFLDSLTWACRESGKPHPGWYTAKPEISADGSRVAYFSESGGLVRRDTNEATDVFVWIRQ